MKLSYTVSAKKNQLNRTNLIYLIPICSLNLEYILNSITSHDPIVELGVEIIKSLYLIFRVSNAIADYIHLNNILISQIVLRAMK